MAGVRIVFYRDRGGGAPVKKWLEGLSQRALDKCTAKLEALKALGNRLGPPSVSPLRDGIFELKAVESSNHYRILFFYQPGRIVVLANAFLKKQNKVPNREIDKAVKRRNGLPPA